MKHFPVVFALAASFFCTVAHAAPITDKAPVATNANDVISPTASLATYEKLMADGRALRASMASAWSQSTSFEAVGIFQKAVVAAPTLPLRAEAFVEGGEVLQDAAASPQALDAFRNALRQANAPEWKGRALWGIARVEFFQVSQAENNQKGVLKLNAKRLRANYDAAAKVRPLAEADRRDVWSNFARLLEAEGKHLEAAREYSKIVGIVEIESSQVIYGDYAIKQLQKSTNLSTSLQKEAIALTDKIFLVHLPLIKSESNKASWRVAQAELLAQFGENARADAMFNEIANDTRTPEKMRVETIVKIAQSQTAQNKYDAALLTLDRLPKVSVLSNTTYRLERGKVLLAQEKYDLATSEFFRVTISNKPEERVDGYWGLADVAEKHAGALRLKKAPAAEIAAKVEEQKKALIKASSQIGVSRVSQRMSYERLAQFETAQGNFAEAKKWTEAAAAAKASRGR